MTGADGLLVPVAPSATLEETVSYAVSVATEGDTPAPVHLVCTVSGHHATDDLDQYEDVLERATRRAREAGPDSLSVESALLGADRYVAGPTDHIELFVEYAADHGLERVVLDPNYSIDATAPTLQSIESTFARTPLECERAPVSASGWQPTNGELVRAGIIGIVSFGFYIALGGPTYTFALFSGVVAAAIAAALLRNAAFETTPKPVSALQTVGRGLVFVPYLLWEITKANVLFAYVVLHPSLPIDPGLDRIDAAVSDGISVTAFANSITLTPGTLTVDAEGHHLLVHSLTPGARDDVVDGVHERAVRYLFYGREGLELPSPGERNDDEPLLGPAADADRTDGHADGGTQDD
ncbi:monovalent cation/H+ antiporter subunit E [Natronolimnobius sp. AArcel1]|uniref:monovalent cation/H+ antiporter subunit E n=1 Tax=Natronolimnobius sp. AArcel1 TaxID=1679093 RepID=UPI0013ECADB1|nr:monovalent cation/H+ antiporter subunit E [Natronolimnobius sp. AArcel1]